MQSIESFIESALYDKNSGYYYKNNPFGNKGDFVTAPLISPLFSEMIAIWIISFWINIGKPKNFSFVELGPGNGKFCKNFCKVLENFPELKKSIKIYLLEKSEKLIMIQKKLIENNNVIWIKKLNEIREGPILFFGNEFFDAIPIKQFEIKKYKVCEKFIKFKNNKFEKFIYKKITKKTRKNLNNFNLIRKNGVIEFPEQGLHILDMIIKKIKKNNGGVLIVDYGYLKSEGKDTLQSIRAHKKNIYYENKGKADITSLVNFGLLKKYFKNKNFLVSKIVNQGFFLKRLGIMERANILSSKMSFKEKSDLYYRLERLLSANKMGSLFKVIFASSKKINFKLGFK